MRVNHPFYSLAVNLFNFRFTATRKQTEAGGQSSRRDSMDLLISFVDGTTINTALATLMVNSGWALIKSTG